MSDVDEGSLAERRAEEEEEPLIDLYGLSYWEPRSALDRFCVWFGRGSSTAVYVGFAFAVLLLFGVVGAAAYYNPIAGLFTLLSAAPAAVIVWFIWDSDPYETPRLSTVTVTFFLGGLLVSVPLVVNSLTVGYFETLPFVGMALFFLLVVAPLEETVKWLAVRLYGYEGDAFDSAVDGAVLGAVAGLGFATMESAVYVFGGGLTFFVPIEGMSLSALSDAQTGIARSGVSPLHVLWTSVSGYYLGLAKLNKGHKSAILLKGLLIALTLHAGYNIAVTNAEAIGSGLGIGHGATLFVAVAGFYGTGAYYLVRVLRGHRSLVEIRDRTTGVRSAMGMTDEEVDGVMQEEDTGVLALSDENDSYAVPLSFGYDPDDNTVYLMMAYAPDSKKRRWIRNTRTATFVVHDMGENGEADSVVVEGRLHKVPEEERDCAYEALSDNARFTVMHASGALPEDTEYVIYALEPETVSGRRYEHDPGYDMEAPAEV